MIKQSNKQFYQLLASRYRQIFVISSYVIELYCILYAEFFSWEYIAKGIVSHNILPLRTSKVFLSSVKLYVKQ